MFGPSDHYTSNAMLTTSTLQYFGLFQLPCESSYCLLDSYDSLGDFQAFNETHYERRLPTSVILERY